MNIRKALMVVAIIAVVAAAGAGAWVLRTKMQGASAVAAVVNGEAISWAQVDAEVARAAAQFGMDTKSAEFEKQRAEISKAVLDQLIATRLILQEARKRNITATEKEVDEQLDAIKKRFPTEAEFNTALTRNGFTLASLREIIRTNATILFRIAQKDQEAVAQAKARIVQAKLADGAKFEDLAKQYSDDRASAERGGDLGFVTKGTLVKEFEEAAWSLKPGQTSGLVKTQYGLHLIRVYEIKEAAKADFDKIKDQIREQLLAGKREKAFGAWVEEQRKAAKIERFERK
jgi:foldase protein PrsA